MSTERLAEADGDDGKSDTLGVWMGLGDIQPEIRVNPDF
jgi:hypothetical protein